MTDEPRLGDPAASPPDIKPSLARRTILLTAGIIASAVITVSTTFWINRAWDRWSTEKKTLFLTTVSSQNLATPPEGLASPLEFGLVLSPTNKRIIKSLFSYQVAIKNSSTASVENLTLHLYPPPSVKLVDPPRIICDSKILQDFVSQSERVSEKEIVFDLDLLGPGQRVMLAYAGYSEEEIADGSFIDVETRKKGWTVLKRIPDFSSTYDPTTGRLVTSNGLGYTDYAYPDFEPYERSLPSPLSKRIIEYNGADVIALLVLLVIVTCISGLLTWLLARVLSDSSRSFQEWRSLVDRLFRRAG
jgi:hypothetical protein